MVTRARRITAYSKGGYRSGEQSVLVASHNYKSDGTKTGVITCHGVVGVATDVIDPTANPRAYAMADLGIPVLAIDAGDPSVASGLTSGPTSFGNDNSITSLGAAVTFLQTSANGKFSTGSGAKSTKFILTGGSMGALVVLNYLISLANPSSVCSAVSLAIPALDLNDVYVNNKLSEQANIAAAYGVTAPAALPNLATHSPVAYSAANLAKLTMPIHIWATTDDPIASNAASCQTWAASVGSNVTVTDIGAHGHDASAIDAGTYAYWFVPYL